MNIKPTIILWIMTASFNGLAQTDTTFIRYDRNYEDDSLIYSTDTLIAHTELERQPVLYKTMVVPETINTMSARVFGLFLTDVSKSSCNRKGDGQTNRSKDKVTSIAKTDSSWVFNLEIYANCCHEFLCEISVENDSTINFIYRGYGSAYCACNCNYMLTYNVEFIDYDFMKEEVAKIKYTMLNGDDATIREIE